MHYTFFHAFVLGLLLHADCQLAMVMDNVTDQADSGGTAYNIWEAKKIRDTLHVWKDQYADLLQVTTSQDSYGIPRAGSPEDCPFENNVVGCSNYFFTIQDLIGHPHGSDSSNLLPEIFLNGAMHGNERLGPTVVMETAALLLEAASCEAKPNLFSTSWKAELEEAKNCRVKLKADGIDNARRLWLARLVSTRRIVVVPTANALGYSRNEMLEGSVDPDQDFPYDKEEDDLDSCMVSSAARTINELFLDHLFQIALSFHVGDDMIGFSWGSKSWGEYFYSPDLKAQRSLAEAKESRSDLNTNLWIGEINKFSQSPRRGLTEDWAYAASWDTDRVRPCDPKTPLAKYPHNKTVYDNSTNRAISLRFSTKEFSERDTHKLGKSADLFQNDRFDAIVPRGIRMVLSSIDLVQPYVAIVNVGKSVLPDDIVPMMNRGVADCKASNALSVPSENDRLVVEWTVGGGIHFSEVELWYAKWEDLAEEELDCALQSNIDFQNDKRFNKGYTMTSDASVLPETGIGMFSPTGPPRPIPEDSYTGTGKRLGPIFRAEINLEDYGEGEQLVVVAVARSDQNWKDRPDDFGYGPRVSPQSHLINARTDQDWRHENKGKVIQGRRDWHSAPVTLVLAKYPARVGVIPLHDRYNRDVNAGSPGGKGITSTITVLSDKNKKEHMLLTGLLIGSCVVLLGLLMISRKRREKERIRKIVQREETEAEERGINREYLPQMKTLNVHVDGSGLDDEVIDFQDLHAAATHQRAIYAAQMIDHVEDSMLNFFEESLEEQDEMYFGSAGTMA